MDPIETLLNEHGLIRQFVDTLTAAAERLEDGDRPPGEFFSMAVGFAREFADSFHHFKEEHVMFVRLAQKRKGEIDGQIEALRYQHDRGRSLVAAIDASLAGYEAGDPIKTADLLESAAAYASLLRHHIHLEDHVFFPLAVEEMDDEDVAALEEEFEKERDRHGSDTFERNHEVVVDMGSMLAHL